MHACQFYSNYLCLLLLSKSKVKASNSFKEIGTQTGFIRDDANMINNHTFKRGRAL